MENTIQKDIPDFLVEMLKKQYGDKIASDIVNGYNKKRVSSFRVNKLKSSKKEIEDILKKNYRRIRYL